MQYHPNPSSISHANVIHREICVKNFSWTTVVLCKRESGCCCLSFPLFVNFSFSPVKLFVTEFSTPIITRVFKFCIHVERGQVYCGKENQDSVIKFCLLFLFFHLSHQCNTSGNLCRFLRNNCAQDFEIWYKRWVWLVVLCKRESACCGLSFSLFVHFSSSPSKFSATNFSASISLQILYTHWERPSILWDRKQNSDLFCLISHFFHLSLQCNTYGNLWQIFLRNYCT